MRMLHIALANSQLSSTPPLDNFAFRLCVDDMCHGLFENRAVPFFTMVSCETARTIPVVQWNTAERRDPDLAMWPAVLNYRRGLPGRRRSLWPQRKPQAIFRGSINENVATNLDWSRRGELKRVRFRDSRWREQGRLALLHQRCLHPDLLNVRIIEGFKMLSLVNDTHFWACVQSIRDEPRRPTPLPEQAAAYRYIVHVEGNGGWSDRLKHLLLSGAVVLKQDAGVKEFFEPLLLPYRHYVPVSSDLRNLSESVLWAAAHDADVQVIAADAAVFAEEVLSQTALTAYMDALFRQYQVIFHQSVGSSADAWFSKLFQPDRTAQFSCETHELDRSHNSSSSAHTYGLGCFFQALDRNGLVIRPSARFPSVSAAVEAARQPSLV
eukprot:CAMPEP_0115842138 /NCGR_PEP_ID=MMETSP0287-20121206/7645_1 /TAXON_ID=412157 /ORGANISM="Chrysochromulina rotalis, Strain UIO044" /LENGTH=380 /DNA_ID=CAMNT_0003295797 /DNA_START=395 /DNA_END=1537 /DNA_ORIENTATION=+